MRLPPELRCPAHGTPVVGGLDDDGQGAAGLKCTRGCVFPVRGGIPRFVETAGYADAFGLQWNTFRRTQLDSYTGTTISRDRLRRCLGGSLDAVSGRSVLEVGCGAGRFTEVLLAAGARVFACDLSAAVEANYENCARDNGYFVCQADVLALPTKPRAFEVVVALGMIQHTESPERTIEALASRVAPGGLLVIDHYAPLADRAPRLLARLMPRHVLRPAFLRMPPRTALRVARGLTRALLPIHRALWRPGAPARMLRSVWRRLSPVADHYDRLPQLPGSVREEWAQLDTYDWLTDRYKHLRDPAQIASALRAAGLDVLDSRRAGNGVEARARRPLASAAAATADAGAATDSAEGTPAMGGASPGATVARGAAAAGAAAASGATAAGSRSTAAGSGPRASGSGAGSFAAKKASEDAGAASGAAVAEPGGAARPARGGPAAGAAAIAGRTAKGGAKSSPTAKGGAMAGPTAKGATRSAAASSGPPRIRIVVVARLEDHKLASKLRPLASLPEVEEVALVRRTPLALEGVRSLCPPRFVARRRLLGEAWRLASLLRLVSRWPRERTFVVSFFLKPHALHAEIARRLFRVRTIPVALSQEDVELAVSRRLWRSVLRAGHAAGVRGARSRERLVAAGIDAARVFEPPNLHDPSRYPPADPAKADLDVLYVGALVPVKQVDLLLRALALVKFRRKNLRAAVVGGGPLRDTVDDLRRELGLRTNLHVVGPRPFEEVPDWLRRARLFVMTSKMEGLPMAMVEALSCGVPVVVPDVGDVTTVAQHGVNAWVVRESSPEAYAEAILTLLEDEPRRARLAAGALALRERFAAEYSLEAAQRAWRRALFGPGPE